jgi:hypothetical protein
MAGGRWFSADHEARQPARYAYDRQCFLTTSPVGYAGGCAALAGSDLRARVSDIEAATTCPRPRRTHSVCTKPSPEAASRSSMVPPTSPTSTQKPGSRECCDFLGST